MAPDLDAPPLTAAADLVAPRSAPDRRRQVTAGFIALVDCAPLVMARDLGFADAEGIDLKLMRETSWANIRDRLLFGHFDIAHMLAPMPIAATLGLGPIDAPMLTPFVLNLCGNAITVTRAVHQAMAEEGPTGDLDDPRATGLALKRVIEARRRRGAPMLTFGMTFPFSSHNYELRYWLAAAGIDPDHDVRLVVVPPPLMVDAMVSGHIDGSCVGAPWPSVAVDAGVGHLVATAAKLKPGSPEKVIGTREAWAERHPETLAGLIRALDRAAAWCEDPAHVDELAERLARPDVVDAPARLIRRALARQVAADPGGHETTHAN